MLTSSFTLLDRNNEQSVLHTRQIGEWGTDTSSAHKALSYGENIAKIGPIHLEMFDEIRQTMMWTSNAISIRLFSTETAGPIFTKILHDIVALVALLNNAYTWRYPIPFVNAIATKVQSLPFFSQNQLPWQRPEISKKDVQINHMHQNWWKECENWSTGFWDNLSPRNH